MSRMRRFNHLMLAALIALSMVMLEGHFAAHANALVDQCALCATHAEPHSATATTEHIDPAGTGPAEFVALEELKWPASVVCITPPSRGPPTVS